MNKKLKGGVYCDPANLLHIMKDIMAELDRSYKRFDKVGGYLENVLDLADKQNDIANKMYFAGLMEGYEPDYDDDEL